MKKVLTLVCFTFLSAAFSSLEAQISTPQPSPTGKVMQTVGLTDVTLEYSRPGLKGRKAFGELVPFGEIWRTGANASTKLTFGDKVKINGTDVDKGTYALYTIPGEKEWTIIIHKNTTHWGVDGYKQEEDATRFTVPAQKISPSVESFTMGIGNLKNNSADIELMWENTKVAFPVMVNTEEKVMADFKKKLAGPTDGDYYQAARYYLEEKKDLSQAKEWIEMSINKAKEPKFWVVRTKALILAELKDYKGAIDAAQQSLDLAKKADNQDYVRMNEKSISEWKNKK